MSNEKYRVQINIAKKSMSGEYTDTKYIEFHMGDISDVAFSIERDFRPRIAVLLSNAAKDDA